MGRNDRIEIYIRPQEKKKIIEVSERAGKSVSYLMLHAFEYWLHNNPQELKEIADEFSDVLREREIKERERDTGDFLGSFDKLEDKIEWISKNEMEGHITHFVADIMRKEARANYEETMRIKESRLKKRYETESKPMTLEEARRIFKRCTFKGAYYEPSEKGFICKACPDTVWYAFEIVKHLAEKHGISPEERAHSIDGWNDEWEENYKQGCEESKRKEVIQHAKKTTI